MALLSSLQGLRWFHKPTFPALKRWARNTGANRYFTPGEVVKASSFLAGSVPPATAAYLFGFTICLEALLSFFCLFAALAFACFCAACLFLVFGDLSPISRTLADLGINRQLL